MECDTAVQSVELLVEHIRCKHTVVIHCPECNEISHTVTKLNHHLSSSHRINLGKIKNQCTYCGKILESEEFLRLHRETHAVSCLLCNYVGDDMNALVIHIEAKHIGMEPVTKDNSQNIVSINNSDIVTKEVEENNTDIHTKSEIEKMNLRPKNKASKNRVCEKLSTNKLKCRTSRSKENVSDKEKQVKKSEIKSKKSQILSCEHCPYTTSRIWNLQRHIKE